MALQRDGKQSMYASLRKPQVLVDKNNINKRDFSEVFVLILHDILQRVNFKISFRNLYIK